jgi:hypothetical protein
MLSLPNMKITVEIDGKAAAIEVEFTPDDARFEKHWQEVGAAIQHAFRKMANEQKPPVKPVLP